MFNQYLLSAYYSRNAGARRSNTKAVNCHTGDICHVIVQKSTVGNTKSSDKFSLWEQESLYQEYNIWDGFQKRAPRHGRMKSIVLVVCMNGGTEGGYIKCSAGEGTTHWFFSSGGKSHFGYIILSCNSVFLVPLLKSFEIVAKIIP